MRARLVTVLVTLYSVLLSASANALVIIQYHHISDETPAATSTSPALFAKHLHLIESSGYKVVGLDALTGAIRRGADLPDETVLITFDDSYSSIYDTAFPLLQKRGWPFVVFANVEPVDTGLRGFMSWQQLREMGDAGAAIANHTVNHPHMVRRAPDQNMSQWRRQMREQIQVAEKRVKEKTGQSHRVLAYPYGEYDSQLTALLAELGFIGMAQNSGAASTELALALPRFPYGGRFGGLDDFALKLRSLPMPLDSVQISDERGKPLADGLLPARVSRPRVELVLTEPALVDALQCFVSGQREPIDKHVTPARGSKPASVVFQAQTALPVGRARYNCTAQSSSADRFHWYSVPFLRPNPDGSFPPEP